MILLGYPLLPCKIKGGPGLLSTRSRVNKIIEWTPYPISARLTSEGTVQSCCEYFGSITEVYIIKGRFGGCTCPIRVTQVSTAHFSWVELSSLRLTFSKCSPFLSPLYTCLSSSRILPFSPIKRNLVSPHSFLLG